MVVPRLIPDDTPALPPGFVVAPGKSVGNGSPPIIVHEASKARFILLPEGRFEMGTSDAKHPYEDEKPAHTVSLAPFYLQETEVTFGQMEWFFETHRDVERPEDYVGALDALKARCPSTEEALEHPAVYISRDLAGRVAEAMGGRLPTEAEFEYAARSGGKDYTYVWGDKAETFWEGAPDRKANLGSEGTKPVRRCPDDRTEQGIFDLAGNVREWCFDPWARYSAVAVHNPKGPPVTNPDTGRYAIRGGSFDTPFHKGAHATSRSSLEASTTYDDLGFRVALSIEQ